MKRILFLLGGRDLEMVIIKDILIENGFIEVDGLNYKGYSKAFADKKLKWGARLDDYKEFLDYDGKIISIELDVRGTNITGLNLIQIDHHNENSHKKSSLEQVAELLDINLTRYQQLVAANDRGYIPEMFKCCASNSEIEEIRRKDREAQGVTEKDEELAKQAIKNRICQNGIIVIESATNKFSAICDLLYPFDKLLIYNSEQLTYYGSGAKELAREFNDLVEMGNAYFCGTGDGFFSVVQRKKSQDEILAVKEKIINHIGNSEMETQSYHIFLFPFRWDYKADDKDIDAIDFQHRVSLDKIIEVFNNNPIWEKNQLAFKTVEEFNLSGYFYEFTNDAIFDEEEAFNNTKDKDRVVKSYKVRLLEQKSNSYLIFIKDIPEPYELIVDDIRLAIYNTGVAILSYHLINNKYTHYEDILRINDYGRRIYPQYLSKDTEKGAKESFLADRIRMTLHLKNEIIINANEEFCHYSSINTAREELFKLPEHIRLLLSKNFRTRDPKEHEFLVRWLIDDRMFVLCWHGNDTIAKELCSNKFIESQRIYEYNYQNNPLWHEYIFVDNSYSTCQNKNMNLRLLNEHTYERWTDYNTLFGISRYSFITISENNDYTRNDLLLPHLKNMYFQMIRLCLAQRASILRFSSEVTILSSLNEKTSRITDNISTLTKAYLQFVNKMYFREVTAQEQGIEIYDKIQEFMRIERDVKDLNREIDELHQYARLLQDMKKRKQMNRIQIFGVILIVPALIAGIFGMNTFKQAEIQTYLWKSVSVLLTIALPIIAAITYLLIAYSKRKKNG
jgi:hypothetical protein